MKIYRTSQYKGEEQTIDDLFGSGYLDKMREKLSHQILHEPTTEETVLGLYRGFDHLPEEVNGKYTFSPEKSEQGVLWFAHDLVNGYNGLEYARSHGRYLLTYPLNVVRHIQVVSYDNSDESETRVPEEFFDRCDGLENCPYHMGYELPSGWFFSYKTEKFIICDHDLEIDRVMIV